MNVIYRVRDCKTDRWVADFADKDDAYNFRFCHPTGMYIVEVHQTKRKH